MTTNWVCISREVSGLHHRENRRKIMTTKPFKFFLPECRKTSNIQKKKKLWNKPQTQETPRNGSTYSCYPHTANETHSLKWSGEQKHHPPYKYNYTHIYSLLLTYSVISFTSPSCITMWNEFHDLANPLEIFLALTSFSISRKSLIWRLEKKYSAYTGMELLHCSNENQTLCIST